MSNETKLDDVLALLADWRRFGKACANKRDGDQYLVCADELEALLPAIKAALEDARRYRWIRSATTPGYLHFPNGEMDDGLALGALDAAIDAMAAGEDA